MWKHILKRIKPYASYNDLHSISLSYAKSGCSVEPLASCIKHMQQINPAVDPLVEWEALFAPTLADIAKEKEKKAQAVVCRVKILENLDRLVLNEHVVGLEPKEMRNLWLYHKYGEDDSLSEEQLFSTLIIHYGRSLLTELALSGLYDELYTMYMRRDLFATPYGAMLLIFAKATGKRLLIQNLIEYGRLEQADIVSRFVNIFSESNLSYLYEACQDYSNAIKDGFIDNLHPFQQRFARMAEEMQVSIDDKSLDDFYTSLK